MAPCRAEQTVKGVRAVLGAQACTCITINSGGEGAKGTARSQGLFQQDSTTPSAASNGADGRPPVPAEVCRWGASWLGEL